MNTYLDLFGLMSFSRILTNKNLYKIFDSVCNNPNQKRFKDETIFTMPAPRLIKYYEMDK